MADDSIVSRWKSFWDLASPEEAARHLAELYGPYAIVAATHCAATACVDHRYDDLRFWLAALSRVIAAGRVSRAGDDASLEEAISLLEGSMPSGVAPMPGRGVFALDAKCPVEPHETLALVHAFCRISDHDLRTLAVKQVEKLADRCNSLREVSKPNDPTKH